MVDTEARAFINDLLYDIKTIQFLLDCGRQKETIGILKDILLNIESFKRESAQSSFETKDILEDNFWKERFNGKACLGDIRLKIHEISQKPPSEQEIELKRIEYARFIDRIGSWIGLHTRILKKRTKLPWERKMETALGTVLLALMVLPLLSSLVLRSISQDWGLEGEVFQGMNFERPLSKKLYKNIDFSTSEGDSSARWQGRLLVPKDGLYTLSMIIDDGARLSIDGNTVIERWLDSNSEKLEKEIFLNKGSHPINIEYYNHASGGLLQLFWKIPNSKKEIISMWHLRPVINPNPT